MRKIIIVAFIVVGIFVSFVFISQSSTDLPMQDNAPVETADVLGTEELQDLIEAVDTENPLLAVSFSHNDFFYAETIGVYITASKPDAVILYTTDGSNPAESGAQFTSPLVFTSEQSLKCVVLKAIAIDDTEQSPVATHTYFIGDSVLERFSSFVFSISTDDDNLYGYENGILVQGITYDDYRALNPDRELEIWRQPGNYFNRGREWERPVFVEAFTMDGERIIAQNAGVRIHGGATRYLPQKSLRLIARREYEPEMGTFRGELFEGYVTAGGYESPIISFDTLILRNDGNDWHRGRIRTPLLSVLASQAGFATVSPQAAAAVFLNGEYYGLAWINIRTNEQYLERLYDAPERSFDIVNGGIERVAGVGGSIRSEFERIIEYALQGFTDETLKELEAYFDVDNLLFYHAIQSYIGNRDWLHNNVRIWRYTGARDSVNLAPELDGRWRYIMYDLDISTYMTSSEPPSERSIGRLLSGSFMSPIFSALMQFPDYAEKYANYLCDMAFVHFTEENAKRVMEELDELSFRELEISTAAYDSDLDSILESREMLLRYVHERPAYILAEMKDVFGYTAMFRIVSDGSCKINSISGGEGLYFIENRVPVAPLLLKGQAFGHWLVNGSVRHEEHLLITVHDADADGVVHVAHVAREELPPLLFEDTFDTGELFGFTMRNPAITAVSVQGLFLSDNAHDLKKWQFPEAVINPGELLEFVGRSCTSSDTALKIRLSFNPRYGETVFLSDDEGNILDWVVVQR